MKMKLYSLIATFAMLISANIAFAQQEYIANDNSLIGDGDNPYLETAYTYSVSNASANIEWLVYSDANLGSVVLPDAATFTITGENSASATITWHTGGPFYLTFKETLDGCITYRGVIVMPIANTFELTMAGNVDPVCNVKSGLVLDMDNYDTELVKTSVDYVVNMSKDVTFGINSWEFKGELTLPAGITIADVADITIPAGNGTLNVTTGGDNNIFTITAIPAGVENVTVAVELSSLITTGDVVPMAISLGKALSGTGDAVITVNTATANQTQSNTLKAMPNTSNISFN